MKERIEEMANDIAQICPNLVENCCGQVNCVTHLTLSLYKEGYRKQVEGEWIEVDDGVMIGDAKHLECSKCGVWKSNRQKSNFCPHCGAKMKGGAE